jgi:hypothetical protein
VTENTQVKDKEEQAVKDDKDDKKEMQNVVIQATDLQAAFSEFLIEKKSYSEDNLHDQDQSEEQAKMIQDPIENLEDNEEEKCNIESSKAKDILLKEDKSSIIKENNCNIKESKGKDVESGLENGIKFESIIDQKDNKCDMHESKTKDIELIEDNQKVKPIEKDNQLSYKDSESCVVSLIDAPLPTPSKEESKSSLLHHLDSIISPILSSPHPLLKNLPIYSSQIPYISPPPPKTPPCFISFTPSYPST